MRPAFLPTALLSSLFALNLTGAAVAQQPAAEGRIEHTYVGEPYQEEEKTKVPFYLRYLDPKNTVEAAKLNIWIGSPEAGRVVPGEAVKSMCGDSPTQTVNLETHDGKIMSDLILPVKDVQPGQVCWIQPYLVLKGGTKIWDEPMGVRCDREFVRVEKSPAKLLFNVNFVNTKLSLASKLRYREAKVNGRILEEETLQFEGTEGLAGTNGAIYDLHIRPSKLEYTCSLNGVASPRAEQLEKTLLATPFTMRYYPQGTSAGLTYPGFGPTDKDNVVNLFELLLDSYQLAACSLPNREVQSGDSWRGNLTAGSFLGSKKRTLGQWHVQAVHHGLRNGTSEALIHMEGTSNQRVEKTSASDRVHGSALFDTRGGFFRKVDFSYRGYMQKEGVPVIREFEVSLTRTPVNPNYVAQAAPIQPAPAPAPNPNRNLGVDDDYERPRIIIIIIVPRR